MQRKAPLTPQARKLNRTIARSTMAPADLSTTMTGSSMGRQMPQSRHSVMPGLPSSQEPTAKKPETANHEAEILYLYNTYLQTEAMKLLLKKKTEEKEKKDIRKIAASVKEEDDVKKDLSDVKRRIIAVANLTKLQNTVDEQVGKTDNILAALKKKPQKVLEQLESVLENHDVLKCKNVQIPQTVEETMEAQSQLANCASLLTSIHNSIGNKSDALNALNKDLDHLQNTAIALSDVSEKMRENLERLQVSTLEEGEKSLMLPRACKSRTILPDLS